MSMQLGQKGLNSDINVTPLVDVMLVLLIIFMVITPMLQKGKAVQLPPVDQPDKQADNNMDIVVSLEYLGPKKYNVYLGRELIQETSLRSSLEDELRRNPAKTLFLKGDQRLSYGAVRKVMELCHTAGFPQVKLATEEKKKKM